MTYFESIEKFNHGFNLRKNYTFGLILVQTIISRNKWEKEIQPSKVRKNNYCSRVNPRTTKK